MTAMQHQPLTREYIPARRPAPSQPASVPARRLTARRAIVRRMSRCMLVSVGTTLLSAVVLVALALGMGVPAGTANVIAVCCGIGPSYFANRHWVWSKSGRSDLVHEVVPFWLLSLAGLVASTMAVSLAGSASAHWPTPVRALALPVANLSVFAALWLVQFALLDRVLFRVVPIMPVPNMPVPSVPAPNGAPSSIPSSSSLSSHERVLPNALVTKESPA